jgi:hypothetical protein
VNCQRAKASPEKGLAMSSENSHEKDHKL